MRFNRCSSTTAIAAIAVLSAGALATSASFAQMAQSTHSSPKVANATASSVSSKPSPPSSRVGVAVLVRTADTMGANGLDTLRYADEGTGWTYGQSHVPGGAWPKITVHAQTRTINYRTASMRDEITLSRAEPKGGGGYPASGRQTNDQYISGELAWNMAGGNAQPGPRFVGDRIHQLWLTPHGIVKAAIRNNATLVGGGAKGRGPATLSFTEPGRFTASVVINADNVVERIESRAPDAVMGETTVVTRYSDYRKHGAILFPSRVEQSVSGHATLDVRVTRVEPNVAADISAPEAVRTAQEKVTADQVADGVWFLAGGSHNSVAILMRDYLILVETPLNDGRSVPVIEQALKLGAGRPIRYVINSHQHFDHSGGVRMAAALGATIVTHAGNVEWYRKTLATKNTIAPDLFAKSLRTPRFIGVDASDRLIIDDGERRVELLDITGSVHNEGFLMVWLPKERLLVEADAFTPGPTDSFVPPVPAPNSVNLVDNIERYGLNVDRILPLHGRVAPISALYAATKRVPVR